MKLTCHWRVFTDADVLDGDVNVPYRTEHMEFQFSDILNVLDTFVPQFEPHGPMEWSASNPRQGDWLTLNGNVWDFSSDVQQYFDLSLHGDLADLTTFQGEWNWQ